ncbi:MAG: aspartate carbamoyltransferase [Candidatus Micrarchaeota archaeon]|nr:aspartate carbamoyltransferase [Candidatus Micrarchaeota archaeon]
MGGKDLISIRDLAREEIEELFELTDKMDKRLASDSKPLKNAVIATLFFEPSTRTRFSFQSAAARLGADVLSLEDISTTSAAKGETFIDTIRTMDGYCDLIVIRHKLEGSARLAADVAERPVVNAGDGGNQHPTQTLIDLYSIRRFKKRIEKTNVCLVGDLKYARTMRSLLYGLGMFGANVTLVSPKGLEMDKAVISEVKSRFSASVSETNAMDFSDCDVLYVCRIQKERFADPYEAEKVQKEFRITGENLKGAKPEMVILHPLPKIDEIAPEVDASPNARYFEQAKFGVPIRMAVIMKLLGKA